MLHTSLAPKVERLKREVYSPLSLPLNRTRPLSERGQTVLGITARLSHDQLEVPFFYRFILL